MRSAVQDEGTGGDGSRIACDVLPKARETSFRRAHRMAARFRTLPRRRRQAVAARRCVDLIDPEYEAIGVVRKMSALERVADRRSRARSTTMLRRTMRSQRDAGESLCPNSRSARGGSSRAERGTARSASPHRVLISAAPQAPRSDRLREQARAWPSGRRRTLCSCKGCALLAAAPGLVRPPPGPRRRRRAGLGQAVATSSSRQVRYEPGRAARATSPAGTERSSPGLQPVRRVAGGARAVVSSCRA